MRLDSTKMQGETVKIHKSVCGCTDLPIMRFQVFHSGDYEHSGMCRRKTYKLCRGPGCLNYQDRWRHPHIGSRRIFRNIVTVLAHSMVSHPITQQFHDLLTTCFGYLFSLLVCVTGAVFSIQTIQISLRNSFKEFQNILQRISLQ